VGREKEINATQKKKEKEKNGSQAHSSVKVRNRPISPPLEGDSGEQVLTGLPPTIKQGRRGTKVDDGGRGPGITIDMKKRTKGKKVFSE